MRITIRFSMDHQLLYMLVLGILISQDGIAGTDGTHGIDGDMAGAEMPLFTIISIFHGVILMDGAEETYS